MSDNILTKEKALEIIPDSELIHTFTNKNYMIIGADWNRSDIVDLINKTQFIYKSGPTAKKMNHGIAIRIDDHYLFIETKNSYQS